MRNFSNVVIDAISNELISLFYLVKIEFNAGTIFHTSLPYSVTIDLETYSPGSGLASISPPRMSNVVDREAYKITYLDPTLSFISHFVGGAIGTKVTVKVGFFNNTESDIGVYPPGSPILDPQHITIAYKGIIDSPGYSIDPNGDAVLVIECSSPMANLDLLKSIFTTKEAINKVAPSDTCYDQVHIGSTVVNLLWGKA